MQVIEVQDNGKNYRCVRILTEKVRSRWAALPYEYVGVYGYKGYDENGPLHDVGRHQRAAKAVITGELIITMYREWLIE